MPGLVHVLGLVGPHLYAPGIGAYTRDLFFLEPIAALEFKARRIAAGISAPFFSLVAGFHLPRADDDEIAFADLNLLRGRAGIEVIVGDAFALFEGVNFLPAGDVEQHAPADQLVFGVLDAELARAIRVHRASGMPVVHLVMVEDVPKRIPVRGRLDRHVERIVGVEQAALPARQRIGAGRQHGVDGVPAFAEQPTLRPALP
jgi:hypothetical protein